MNVAKVENARNWSSAMDDIAIIGVGQSVFSRKCGVSIRELCFDAFKEAMEGLDINIGDIDASIICSSPGYEK